MNINWIHHFVIHKWAQGDVNLHPREKNKKRVLFNHQHLNGRSIRSLRRRKLVLLVGSIISIQEPRSHLKSQPPSSFKSMMNMIKLPPLSLSSLCHPIRFPWASRLAISHATAVILNCCTTAPIISIILRVVNSPKIYYCFQSTATLSNCLLITCVPNLNVNFISGEDSRCVRRRRDSSFRELMKERRLTILSPWRTIIHHRHYELFLRGGEGITWNKSNRFSEIDTIFRAFLFGWGNRVNLIKLGIE